MPTSSSSTHRTPREPRRSITIPSICFHSGSITSPGDAAILASPYTLDTSSEKRVHRHSRSSARRYLRHSGYVRLVLPVEILASGVEKILELFRQALGTFPWVSGYAGYSLFWHARHLEHRAAVSRFIGPRLLRHPGLNMGEPMFFKKWAKDSVLGANWITFLSPRFVDELGSLSSISQNLSNHSLSARVDIEELPSGVLLRAGAMPEIGDSNRPSVTVVRSVSHRGSTSETDTGEKTAPPDRALRRQHLAMAGTIR